MIIIPEIELYPSERNDAMILLASLQRRYGETLDTVANLENFAREAETRFAEELGLIVEIDMFNYVQDARGDVVLSPVIHPIERVADEQFDFDKAIRETQLGYVDGQPGRIMPDGTWREPKKNL